MSQADDVIKQDYRFFHEYSYYGVVIGGLNFYLISVGQNNTNLA